MKPPSDRRKIGLILGNLVLGAVVLAVAHHAGQSQDAADRAERIRDAQSEVSRVRRALVEVDAARRGFIISPRKPFLEDLESAEREVTRGVERLAELAQGDPEAERRATTLGTLAARAIADSRLVLEMARTYPFSVFREVVRGFREKPERLQLFALLDALEQAEHERLDRELSLHIRSRNLTEVVLGFAALLGLGAFNYVYLAGLRLEVRRRAAEGALRESEARFRMFMEQLPAAIFIKDAQRRRVYVNGWWEQTFGFTLAGIQNRTDTELWEPDVAALIEHDDLAVLRKGVITERVQSFTKPSGERLLLAVYRFPLTTATGERMIGGAALDITEQERNRRELQENAAKLEAAHAELLAAKADAERANHAKRDFLASMSHEIRTPLNGILGVASLLRETELNAEQQDYAELIHTSAQALLTILNDILDFSKIEAGKIELDPRPFDLSHTVQQVVALFTPRAHDKGLQLELQYPGAAPKWAVGDGPRIQQIVTNLVSNAIKFTEQGIVRVQVEYVRPSFRISVEDTGIGISLEAQSRLFQYFHQADASTARRYGGTGLGLAIARQLAELMSGWIELDSTVGAGSRFTVVLPLEIVHQAAQQGSATEERRRVLQVLLAEDNAVNQKVSSRLLERLGCRVDIAANGTEAVRIFDPARHGIVFMDCSMPVLDGYGATQQIREQHGADVPIVALTAGAVRGAERRCFEAGMDDYVTKPVGLDALARVLARWCPNHSPLPSAHELAHLDAALTDVAPAPHFTQP